MFNDERIVCWFSAGAASAVATKLAIEREADRNVVVATIDVGSEHPDNERFRKECAEWFGKEITVLKSEKYNNTWEVWEDTGYLVGPQGARCTGELKKKPRFAFERPSDIQVFGYTVEEKSRAERFIDQNPGIEIMTPLIDSNLTKLDCLSLIDRAGIELPAMYLLGYRNNNCIGCVKGGMGYWNKIRVDFPEVFERMAKLERNMGRTVIRSKGQPVFLDELDPNRGRYDAEEAGECGIVCQDVEVEISSRNTDDGEACDDF